MQDVAGKVAFITGGGSGIGLGMAQVFLENGIKVAIADIRQDHLDAAMLQLKSFGAQVHAVRVDVTDRKAMAHAADEVERALGKVQILCNNAGINLFDDIADATYEDYDWVLGVNFGGVVNGVQTFLPRIKAQGQGGHIVNTASMASFISSSRAGIYSTAKFAVRGLSEALLWSLRPLGIGVSVLCPGLVDSQIYESDQIRPQHLAQQRTPPPAGFTSWLANLHHTSGMQPVEVGRKVLRALQRNDFYIFTHPEFKEELREIFDEALAALPDETPPADRLAFEDSRRAAKAKARASWK